ncbi:MAG: hypothetical protein ACLQBX_12665 [Candidatus Limnocylindrales bacterium]
MAVLVLGHLRCDTTLWDVTQSCGHTRNLFSSGAPWGELETYVRSEHLASHLGGGRAAEPGTWSAVDPIELLAASRVPVLVIYGAANRTNPASFS